MSSIKLPENMQVDPQALSAQRDKTIVRTSIIGILANVALAAFKATVGLLSSSIAIVLDAVNNLSDAASSVITIIGTKLAAKEPDKKHPFGYGRIEYLSAMVISMLVLYAGVTSLVESIKKIIHPDTPDYSTAALIIVGAGVLVKILLGWYVRRTGEKVHSDSLVNSGKDATLDAIISASTLAAAVIFLLTGLSLEAWLGAVISLIIIKSGLSMLLETLSKVLGERADAELARAVKETVLSFEEVSGAYDLVLHDYGPDTYNGSIHIEVPDTFSADRIDELLRTITVKVLREHNVLLTAIGIYSVHTKEDAFSEMRETLHNAVMSIPGITEMHGFYVNEDQKTLRFDVVVSFNVPNRRDVYSEACNKAKELFPAYRISVGFDSDFAGD